VLTFAQISDLHLDGDEHSTARATRVLGHLNDLPGELDAILVTGDIADHGLVEEYRLAAKILDSRYPVLCCPGNHDARAAYRTGLLGVDAAQAGGEPINTVHRLPGAVFAMCDSTIPGEDDGLLADETIGWLDGVLRDSQDDVPAFVCFHHPPVLLHQPYLDSIRQFGEQRLAEVIAAHPQVVAVLCGHAHTAAASTFAGRPLLVSPGVVSTIVLPWERGELVDLRQPPGVAFHVLDDEHRLTTHYRVVV
jgi:3',5'-cyclic AMP phosphodiesterase CpdA